MKKILILMMFLCMALVLMSCKKDQATTSTASTEEPSDVVYDLGGQKFIIMANQPRTADPRRESYEGLFQHEKQERIRYVEEKYNIEVVFTEYPSQAVWGGARENWIINSVMTGSPAAHVYELSSISVPIVAEKGVLIPLKQYIDKYDNGEMNDNTKIFGHFKGDYYVYDDRYAINKGGIYYNQDLLVEVGYERDYPYQLYKQGKWDWNTFEELVKALNDKLDENNSYYPMGGKTYNWAYQMIAANGGYIINNDLEVGITNAEAIEAMNYLASLYAISGMWVDESAYEYAVDPKFRDGKVVFHPGEYWWLFDNQRFGERSFERVGYVPFPKGPKILEDGSNYNNIQIWGPAVYVLSAGYQAPKGYETMVFHDELIFQIWRDLQYFGEYEDYKLDFSLELMKYYADEDSVSAHSDVMDKLQNELFYALGQDASGFGEGSYMLTMERAIRQNNVRAEMEAIVDTMKQKIEERFIN